MQQTIRYFTLPVALTLAMNLLSTTAVFADAISDALNAPARMQEDRVRDERSRPDVTLPLLKLKAGDRVADIFGGAGYYSELIASLVGKSGEVLLLNNQAYAQFAKNGLAKRMQSRDIGPVRVLTRETEALELGISTLDAALMVMSYHDIYWVDEEQGWPKIDTRTFLKQISLALKPGGRLLIVDHHATPGSGKSAAQDLHRIDVEFAKRTISAHGFRLAEQSDALRNPSDDHSLYVFDPKVRGMTDRFVLAFEKI